MGSFTREILIAVQQVQKHHYNKNAWLQLWQLGDLVLLLRLLAKSKLLAKWQGSYEVLMKVGDMDYEVWLVGR